MYPQKVKANKTLKKNFAGVLKVTDEKSRSGSVSKRYESTDLDLSVPKCHGSGFRGTAYHKRFQKILKYSTLGNFFLYRNHLLQNQAFPFEQLVEK